MTRDELVAKFEKNVIRHGADECWDWGKQKPVNRYGQANFNGFMMTAHRISYEIHYGSIPDGLEVLHKCDNKRCCNPKHLFVGTQKDNCDDRDAKNRVQHGERHADAKLTQGDVDNIRYFAAAGIPAEDIARKYKINRRHVGRIARGEQWSRSFQEAMNYENAEVQS